MSSQPTRNAELSFSMSEALLARARQSMAGGADSTMRVLPYHLPLAIAKADGAVMIDEDGNKLIDLNMGYGPLIFGHRPQFIVDAITEELGRRGTALGFPHALSHQVAEYVKAAFPSIELLRFASTGTEVDQTAVRLARAFTGRSQIVIFEGHYHGSTDAVFHKYHAPVAALNTNGRYGALPGTGGMNGAPRDAYLLPWNDVDAVEHVFAAHGGEIAAVIMEPVAGNMGVVPPKTGYLMAVREITRRHGALLIFDEVITGFRVAHGGAQERYGVAADITALSKALGGGVPISAVGGRRDILALLERGDVFHGGVYSGTPMCVAAALATQQRLATQTGAIYDALEASAELLTSGLQQQLASAGIAHRVQRVGPMLSCWLTRETHSDTLTDYRGVARAIDFERYIAFQHAAQRSGVYFHPNAFEPWYLSTAHTPDMIELLLERLSVAITEIA